MFDQLSIEIALEKDELQVILWHLAGPFEIATGAVSYEVLADVLKPYLGIQEGPRSGPSERELIVKYLRTMPAMTSDQFTPMDASSLADAIERGDHLKRGEPGK